MAVALNPTKTLYSVKKPNDSKDDESQQNHSHSMNSSSKYSNNLPNLYADSPSRQVRRSARVASLSPSSFAPLVSTNSSGTSSAISSASSYAPASPSRKYSLMKSGKIDEIISDSENGLYPSLRKRQILEFQPTSLSTPSTTLSGLSTNPTNSSSGITPSVKNINLQETPSQKILENLVTRKEMEEIAKATPLGSKSFVSVKNSIEPNSKPINTTENKATSSTSGYNSINHNNNTKNPNHTNNNTTNNNMNFYSNINNNKRNSPSPTKTPTKQTVYNNSNISNTNNDADETVKVVRTLRNRSIVASPLPAGNRRKSISPQFEGDHRSQQPKIDIELFFRRHRKNFLAYSLLGLFLAATVYHIYDGLFGVKITAGTEDLPTANIEKIVLDDPEKIAQIIDSKVSAESHEIVQKLSTQVDDRLDQISSLMASRLSQFKTDLNARIDSIQPNLQQMEIQQRSLNSVVSSIKALENRLKQMELKVENLSVHSKDIENEKASSNSNNPSSTSHNNNLLKKTQELPVKIVKNLSSTPLRRGWNSSIYAPENAISSASKEAFKFSGNRGKLAVLVPKLPQSILIGQLEEDDVSCAPKDFEIWLLQNPLSERESPLLLAKGTFNPLFSGENSHEFPLNLSSALKSKIKPNKPLVLQLRIRSNHGNPNFTCLYSFKALQS